MIIDVGCDIQIYVDRYVLRDDVDTIMKYDVDDYVAVDWETGNDVAGYSSTEQQFDAYKGELLTLLSIPDDLDFVVRNSVRVDHSYNLMKHALQLVYQIPLPWGFDNSKGNATYHIDVLRIRWLGPKRGELVFDDISIVDS